MQCQGRTRSGKRCRNRSLDTELFCDIHMRVNHAHNLALMLPLILGVLVAYFFFFGMFFNTVIFGIFDINYLKYAGLEDLLLNMVHFGAIITLIILLIWISYAVILSIGCAIWLIFRMVKSTGMSGLGLGDRMKVIGTSLLIYMINILMLIVVLFPKRNRKPFDRMALARQKMALSLDDLRIREGGPIKGRPLINAQDVYQNYLYFRSVGNHRFFMSIALLFLVTLAVTYYTGHEAQRTRTCSLEKAGNIELNSPDILPFPAYILKQDCISSDQQQNDPDGLTATFVRALWGIFKFSSVIVQSPEGQIELLHLATTSRFDLFFNGADGRSLALPRGILTLQDATKEKDDGNSLFSALKRQFGKLEQNISQSNRTLFGLGRDLQKTTAELNRLNQTSSRRNQSQNLPSLASRLSHLPPHLASCWTKEPSLYVQFIKEAHILKQASTLKSILRLSRKILKKPNQTILLAGYADPPGDDTFNFRLSLKRAQHVSTLLQNLGISETRLYAAGMGENSSRDLPRRRVEIRICD